MPQNIVPTTPQPRLILGSSSRYRKELLSRLCLPFDVAVADIDETPYSGELPEQTALRLARAKAKAVAARFPGALVIGSDQVATLDGKQMKKKMALKQEKLDLNFKSQSSLSVPEISFLN